jgi:nicotinamidase-related amidase
VKRAIGAFQDTELDARLRQLGVTTLVFGGIATNLGAESTARAALDLGYQSGGVAEGASTLDLVLVEDATAAFTAAEHEASARLDFPRPGPVVTADQMRFVAR